MADIWCNTKTDLPERRYHRETDLAEDRVQGRALVNKVQNPKSTKSGYFLTS